MYILLSVESLYVYVYVMKLVSNVYIYTRIKAHAYARAFNSSWGALPPNPPEHCTEHASTPTFKAAAYSPYQQDLNNCLSFEGGGWHKQSTEINQEWDPIWGAFWYRFFIVFNGIRGANCSRKSTPNHSKKASK